VKAALSLLAVTTGKLANWPAVIKGYNKANVSPGTRWWDKETVGTCQLSTQQFDRTRTEKPRYIHSHKDEQGEATKTNLNADQDRRLEQDNRSTVRDRTLILN